MHLLLLEDELIISKYLSNLIEKNINLKVITCSNYNEMVLILSQMDISIALLDINLNDKKNGIDAAKYINENYRIPFIYLTGNTDISTSKEIASTSPSGYIAKPVNEAALIAIIKTVKQNKLLENELKEQKNLLYSLINSIPESIFLIDRSGIVLQGNQEGFRRFNKNPEEVLNKSISEIIPNDIKPFREKMINISVKSGKPVTFEDYRNPYHFKNYINPIINNSNSVDYFSIFAVDTTREKNASIQRDNLYNEIENILEFSPVGLSIIDENCKIIKSNSTFKTLFELNNSDEHFCFKLFNLHKCNNNRCLIKNKSNKTFEFHVFPKINGEKKHYLVKEMKYNSKQYNKKGEVLLSVTDISEYTKIIKTASENIENEKKIIGQELHDSIGQKLTGLSFITKNLSYQIKANLPDCISTIDLISENIQDTIKIIRNLSKGIWPINIREHGFTNSIFELVSSFKIIYNVDIKIIFKIPIEFDNIFKANNIYFIIQEALLNAIKHGNEKAIVLKIERFNEDIHITIENSLNNLKNCNTSPGIGNQIIQYRAGLTDSEIATSFNNGKYIFELFCNI